MHQAGEQRVRQPTISGTVTLSVIVCAYTELRRPLLIDSLEAILSQLDSSDELIVVIDYNEALYDYVSQRYQGRVVTVRNGNERGLSGARNAGVAAASGDVVAFVDDDAEVQSNWARKMRSHYSEPDIVGVGGRALPVWPGSRPTWLPREYDWVVGCSHDGLPTDVTPVRNFIGCNMSFRREVLESVGQFNTGVGRVGTNPVGCEETELCIRISQADNNARLILDPGVVVNHHVSHDRASFAYFVRRCFSEGLSKYRVSNTVGVDDALRTERHYVAKVLPIAFLKGIWGFVTGRDGRCGALARSGAIVVGLHVTAVGYVYSMLRTRLDAAP